MTSLISSAIDASTGSSGKNVRPVTRAITEILVLGFRVCRVTAIRGARPAVFVILSLENAHAERVSRAGTAASASRVMWSRRWDASVSKVQIRKKSQSNCTFLLFQHFTKLFKLILSVRENHTVWSWTFIVSVFYFILFRQNCYIWFFRSEKSCSSQKFLLVDYFISNFVLKITPIEHGRAMKMLYYKTISFLLFLHNAFSLILSTKKTWHCLTASL